MMGCLHVASVSCDNCRNPRELVTGPYHVPTPAPLMTGPHKCPECGVWWVGFEHRCRDPYTVQSTTTSGPPSYCATCASNHLPGACPTYISGDTEHAP